MYAYSYRHYPRIRAYADAAEYEAKIVPIKGDGRRAGRKPFGPRNSHIYIRRMPDDTIQITTGWERDPRKDTVHFIFHPDGTIDYAPMNKALFVAVIGHDSFDRHCAQWVGPMLAATPNGDIEGYFTVQAWSWRKDAQNAWAHFRWEGDKLRYLNPRFPKSIVINRIGANQVKREYQKFLDYASGYLKLRFDGALRGQLGHKNPDWHAEVNRVFGVGSPVRPLTLEQPAHPEWMKWVQSEDPVNWERAIWAFCGSDNWRSVSFELITLYLLKHHADQAFKTVPRYDGKICDTSRYLWLSELR